ncbi:hypothetical protein AB1Y20_021373 [Prymnesium parvum]|uniref:Aspartyl/asparaginy/proline hydroxylase domain-containing protein n=1 Tax=Prymnesium parvum TaxID=97485 RepID=A0AB34JJE5_PRYPA
MRANLFPARILRVKDAIRPNPTLFHYPGLTARPWHEREAAPFNSWVHELEAATADITAEYLQVRAAGTPSDYLPGESDHNSELHTGGEWHWASFIDRGRRREEMWQRCPRTAAALQNVPSLCEGDMPFAFAFFSTLRPGGRIKPHCSPCNLRVRVHLPLIVPEGASCGIRVGSEARAWKPGKCLIFDDAFEHEVWNDGDQARVILLLDLWHWELEQEEIQSIQEMFRVVEAKRDARQQSGSRS